MRGAEGEKLRIVHDLRRLYRHLPAHRLRRLRSILALSAAGAIADMLTIGALMPFLAILSGAGRDSEHLVVRRVAAFISSLDAMNLIAGAFLFLIVTVLLSAAIKTMLYSKSQKFIFGCCHDLAMEMFEKCLWQDYEYHLSVNSSELIAAVYKVKSVSLRTIGPLIQMVSNSVTAALLLVTLFLIDPVVAALSISALSVGYLIVGLIMREPLRTNSANIAKFQSKRVQSMQESLGAIREVLLHGAQSHFTARFGVFDLAMCDARARAAIIGMVPKYLIEAASILGIVGLAYYLGERSGGFAAAIPVLGSLILGMQKLLPAVQNSYSNWAGIRSNHHAMLDVLEKLELPASGQRRAVTAPSISFTRALTLIDVSYEYPDRTGAALSGLNLSIQRGARIGIAGPTGSGKSTFADLILGLLIPTSGQILVDGAPLTAANVCGWQERVANVDQDIFLADCSIRENIAFCEPNDAIDQGRLHKALEAAALVEFVADLPAGLETIVGENGVNLSGGQKQRVGIARAIYKQANLLIFDEATSSLDRETERGIINAIRSIDRETTIIVIAHRASAIEWCDQIFTIENGRLSHQDRY